MTITAKPEFLIGTVPDYLTFKSATKASIAQLKDGRVVIAWQQNPAMATEIDRNGWFDRTIYVGMFDTEGKSLSAPVKITSDDEGIHGDPQIVALADGGYMVSWTKLENIDGEQYYESMVRAFDKNGTARGDQADVSQDITPPEGKSDGYYNANDYSSLMALAGGGAIISYTHEGTDTAYARVLGANGQAKGAAVKLYSDILPAEIVQLKNGKIVLVDSGDTSFTFKISDPDLQNAIEVSHVLDVDSEVAETSHPSITALSTGGFATLYRYNEDIRQRDKPEVMKIDWFDASGKFQRSSQITQPEDSIKSVHSIVGLEGGAVAVLWVQYNPAQATDYILTAQLIDADGTLNGAPVTYNADDETQQLWLDTVVMNNGKMFSVFFDSFLRELDGDSDTLHGRIIDFGLGEKSVNKSGTKGADTLKGGMGDDVLRGLGGNDALQGKGGDDRLIGGNGNDRLFGQTGHDRLEGGRGNDKLVGGGGSDRLFGGAGADKLEGQVGKDLLVGGTGADTLLGQKGDDILRGNGGNDRLVGHAGRDTLSGGHGNDVLSGGKGVDVFVFGPGKDRVTDYDDTPGVDQATSRNVEDKVDMRGAHGIIDFGDMRTNHVTDVRKGVLISDAKGHSMLLVGIQSTDLDQSDFIFA